MKTPEYTGGLNVAMKVPPHQYEETVRFYERTLGSSRMEGEDSVSFRFGPNRLWIDRCPQLSQAEIWLEIITSSAEEAQSHLAGCGVPRCDEVEPLSPGFPGFWILNPAGIVHLVAERTET